MTCILLYNFWIVKGSYYKILISNVFFQLHCPHTCINIFTKLLLYNIYIYTLENAHPKRQMGEGCIGINQIKLIPWRKAQVFLPQRLWSGFLAWRPMTSDFCGHDQPGELNPAHLLLTSSIINPWLFSPLQNSREVDCHSWLQKHRGIIR